MEKKHNFETHCRSSKKYVDMDVYIVSIRYREAHLSPDEMRKQK